MRTNAPSVLAAITFLAAIGVAIMLPRERKFVRSVGLAVSLQQMLRPAYICPALRVAG